jgi:hypothetical protein
MHVVKAVLWTVVVGALAAGGAGGAAIGSPDVGAGSVGPVAVSIPLQADPRPANGAQLIVRGAKGRGTMTIENGTSHDAVVTLAAGSSASHAVYIYAGSNARIDSIADATYVVYVQQGESWNNGLRKFMVGAQYDKFDSPATFRTTRKSDGIEYTEFKITLQPVAGGNARSVTVNPEEIPQ